MIDELLLIYKNKMNTKHLKMQGTRTIQIPKEIQMDSKQCPLSRISELSWVRKGRKTTNIHD